MDTNRAYRETCKLPWYKQLFVLTYFGSLFAIYSICELIRKKK